MFSERTGWKLTPNRLTETQRTLAAAGIDVLDLTVSNPTRVGLPYDSDAILRAFVNPQLLDYDPQPKGLAATREAVADYYREQHRGFDLSPESLVLTTSTSEGYSHVFRLLCNPEDEVLVPKPSYPLFEFLADLQDVKLVPYPLLYDHGWQIDFPSLYKAVNHRTRAVVVVHPNNPTGSFVSETERAELNAFCGAYNLALVADEVFLDYALDGGPRSTWALNRESLTFTLSGLSKISALPQMKLAWIAVSGPQVKSAEALARLEVIADTFLSVNAPIQLAAPALLAERKKLQPILLDRLRGNLVELDRQLPRRKSCQRLNVQGGWYTVLRVPATQPDEDLAVELLEKTSVLVHPGHFYDFPADGYLVLSLIVQPQLFAEGIERVLNWIGR